VKNVSDTLQAMAFKPILEGQSCIVADQTGSGKTLAYLAPLVQILRAEEGKSQTKQLNKKPRVLVLVPTSELAVQVGTFDCFVFSIVTIFEQI
jgi:ATP-dependent RNA helicase DDX18/HAS1